MGAHLYVCSIYGSQCITKHMSASPSARDAAQLLVRKLDGVLGAGVGGVEVYTGVKVWLEVLADLYDADMEARI